MSLKRKQIDCEYHIGRLGCFHCDKCGKAICPDCITKFKRITWSDEWKWDFLCMNCFWPDERASILNSLNFTNYLFTPIIIINLILFISLGNFSGFVNLSRIIGPLYFPFAATYLVLFLTHKKRYLNWRKEIRLKTQSENTTLEMDETILHEVVFLIIEGIGIILFLIGFVLSFFNIPGETFLNQWVIVGGLLLTWGFAWLLIRLNIRFLKSPEVIREISFIDWIKVGSVISVIGFLFFIFFVRDTMYMTFFRVNFFIGSALLWIGIFIILGSLILWVPKIKRDKYSHPKSALVPLILLLSLCICLAILNFWNIFII